MGPSLRTLLGCAVPAKRERSLKCPSLRSAPLACNRKVGGVAPRVATQLVQVCGRLVEVLSGVRLGEYLREHVFEPLAMHDTAFQARISSPCSTHLHAL